MSAELSGLLPGSTYHFRAVAMNFGGTTHGPDLTFTTQNVPSIESAGASAVTQATATLSALIDPQLSSTTYHFDFGVSSGYGQSTPETALVGGSPQEGSAALTRLAPGTTYHFRAVATNLLGTTMTSDHTLTTLAPTVLEKPTPSKGCKKGFVKKRGKCVKRRKSKRRGSRRGGRRG